MNNITIKDLAKIANVSYSTVSRALTDSALINENTRKHILQIAREKGYQVNVAARSLIVKKSKLFGLIVPDSNIPYYSETVSDVESYSQDLGYNIILCNGRRNTKKEEELTKFLIQHQVDGLLYTSSVKANMHLWDYAMPKNIPTVCLGCPIPGVEDNFVYTDNYLGGYSGIEYLYGLGHTKIIYIGARNNSLTHQNRLEGAKNALKKFSLEESILNNFYNGDALQDGYRLGAEYFEEGIRHTAIFAASDSFAIGIMKAADEFKIHIPNDISLLGYDNIAYASLPRIALTTISQKRNDIAKKAVDLLVTIDKASTYEEFTRVILEPSVIERSTCKKL